MALSHLADARGTGEDGAVRDADVADFASCVTLTSARLEQVLEPRQVG